MSKGNILITGASTGIGEACARKFVEEGYTVYGSVRKQEDADRLKEALSELFHPLLFDVTDLEAITKEATRLKDELKGQGLKLLLNNAGIAITGPAELLSVDDFRRQFEVNYFGLIAVTKAFLPLLGATENPSFEAGKIINVSSIASKRTMPFMTPYSSSKAAVDSFTEGLRRELMIYGIDAVTVNPGPIATPIWEKIDLNTGEEVPATYRGILKRLVKLVDKESKGAIEVSDFAEKVFKTFLSKRPKTSEVVMKKKFFKYTLLNLIPVRTIDGFIKKILKI